MVLFASNSDVGIDLIVRSAQRSIPDETTSKNFCWSKWTSYRKLTCMVTFDHEKLEVYSSPSSMPTSLKRSHKNCNPVTLTSAISFGGHPIPS